MKTVKVYHAPGYPLDPKKEEKRALEEFSDYCCKMIPPKPILLKSQTVDFTFGSREEAETFLRNYAKALVEYHKQRKWQ